MKNCREIEGLIAASCYEPLSGAEQVLLDSHLATCAQCRAEAREMRRLVEAIPVPEVTFEGDLLPVLRAEREQHDRVSGWWRRMALPMAAMAAVVALTLVTGYALIPTQNGTDVTRVAAVQPPLEAAQARAGALLEERNYTGALLALDEALKASPGDPLAGAVLAQMAGIEFIHLKRYPKACAAYEQLKSEYPETFSGSPESIYRLDLLTEARLENFEPLHALDRAQDAGEDRFQRLEEVVARYPGTLVAGLTVDTMQDMVRSEMEDPAVDRVAALEAVRSRCSEPVAAAQVAIQLGRTWWKEHNDTEKARELYTDVAQNSDGRLAQLARDALSELNTNRLP